MVKPAGIRQQEMPLSLKEIAGEAVAKAERQAIRLALQTTRGDEREAARLLKVDCETFHRKMKHYSIEARTFSSS